MIGSYMKRQELALAAYGIEGCSGDTHMHADFKMFIDGKELNLYVPENFEKDESTHFHEGSENVIQVHCKNQFTV